MARRITVITAKEALATGERLCEMGYVRKQSRSFKRGGWVVYEKGGDHVVVVFGDGNYKIPQV